MPTPNYITTSYFTQGYYQSGGPFVVQGVVQSGQQSYSSNSFNTPGFSKIHKRALPLHPYSFSHIVSKEPWSVMTMNDYDITVNGPTGAMTVSVFNLNSRAFSLYDVLKWADVPEESVIDKCNAKLLKKLSTQKSSLGVTLAESNKTAKMVAQSATRIYNALTSIKRFDFVGVAVALGVALPSKRHKALIQSKAKFIRKYSHLKRQQNTDVKIYDKMTGKKVYVAETNLLSFAGNSWLEFTYGWKPLMSDIFDSMTALSDVLHQVGYATQYGKARVWSEQEKVFVERIYGESWIQERRVKLFALCEVGVTYQLNDISKLNAFGLTNPLLIAWELVPFSFVVDWFLPIGQALEQLNATHGLVFQKGYQTTRNVREVVTRISQEKLHIFTPGARTRGWDGFVKSSLSNAYQNRVLLNNFPNPTWPSFKDPRSVSHATSALALLSSFFKK